MNELSPYQWWDWDKLRRLAQLLRKETEEILKREKEKGVEWVERWKQHVGYDKLSPKRQLFAVLAGTILDYGVSSECVPLYAQKLKQAGLLDPKKMGKTKKEIVEAVLRSCRGCVTQKIGGKNEEVRCRPFYRKWYEKSAGWLVSLGKRFDEIISEFKEILRDIEIENNAHVLTPSHIYLALLRIDGIGPKKAAMVTRDALVYDHEMTIPKILGKLFNKKIKVKRSCHTLIFTDVNTKRVFKRLGLIQKKELNSIITLQYIAALANPNNPGAVDLTLWHLGREVCKSKNPYCSICPLRGLCYHYNAELKRRT